MVRKTNRFLFFGLKNGAYVACLSHRYISPEGYMVSFIYFTEPPRIFGKRKFHANVGEAAKLICDSRGTPDPAFTWSWKDAENKTVSVSEGEEVSAYSVTTLRVNVKSRSTLEIKKVTTEAWKMYTCKVVNRLGRDIAYISLSGKSKWFFLEISGLLG